MKLITFSCLALLGTAEAFSTGRQQATRSNTALNGNVLENLEPHCDIVGQQGGDNLVENQGWANVQGGAVVDWSVAAASSESEQGGTGGQLSLPPQGGTSAAVPQLFDLVGKEGLAVQTTKQDVFAVQGGSDIDWNDKQFMSGNAF